MVQMRLDPTSSSSGGIATRTVAASIVHSFRLCLCKRSMPGEGYRPITTG